MKRMMNWFAASMVLIMILTGCTSGVKDGATIKIGVNMELSGGVASYGQAELKGIELAFKEVNANGGVLGKQFELVKVDNTSSYAEATSVTTRLIMQDNVVAIVGPATSGSLKASIPVAEDQGVAIISPSATDDLTLIDDATNKVYATAFRVCFNDSFQGVTLANFALSNLEAKKAVVYGDVSSDYAQGLARNFIERFTQNGGTLVAQESYTEGDTDFNSVLTKIKQMDFDVLFIPGYYNEAGLIIKQAREIGIEQPILGADGFESNDLISLAGIANMKRIYYTAHYSTLGDDASVSAFVEAYQAEYGEEPNAFSALGYDAAMMLVDAIKRADSIDRVKIIEALARTEGFEGVAGTVSVDANHDAVKSIFVIEMDGDHAINSVKVNP